MKSGRLPKVCCCRKNEFHEGLARRGDRRWEASELRRRKYAADLASDGGGGRRVRITDRLSRQLERQSIRTCRGLHRLAGSRRSRGRALGKTFDRAGASAW